MQDNNNNTHTTIIFQASGVVGFLVLVEFIFSILIIAQAQKKNCYLPSSIAICVINSLLLLGAIVQMTLAYRKKRKEEYEAAPPGSFVVEGFGSDEQ